MVHIDHDHQWNSIDISGHLAAFLKRNMFYPDSQQSSRPNTNGDFLLRGCTPILCWKFLSAFPCDLPNKNPLKHPH